MKTRLILSLLAAAAIAGGTLPARACVYDPADAPMNIEKADSIFTGTVTAVRYVGGIADQNAPEYKIMFDVDKVFRGHIISPISVMQMHDEWARYTRFKIGKRYLVLTGRKQYNLLITGCSPVMPLDAADADRDTPSPEYRKALAIALGDEAMFPALATLSTDGARKRLKMEIDRDSGDSGN